MSAGQLSVGTLNAASAGSVAGVVVSAALVAVASAVVVAVVAQSFSGTKGSFPIPESFVHTQLDAVIDELPVKVVKVIPRRQFAGASG